MKSLPIQIESEVLHIDTYIKREEQLAQIKHIPMCSDNSRGTPTNIEHEDINTYRNRSGEHIKTWVGDLETNLYLSKLAEKHGLLSKQKTGDIYWISTTNPSSSMNNSVTGTPNGFQYIVDNEGAEVVYFDSCCMAHTKNYICEGDSKQITDKNLQQIIKTINPKTTLV
ncbi:MAG: hypothetical protein ACQESC_04225 [Nanobdellota archaeon]